MSESVRERADRPSAAVGSARERILLTARALFRTGGYERTPLRAISDALGVTKAAVYYHFRAKDDLLAAIVAPMLDRIDEVVDPPCRSVESRSERRDLLARYIRELAEHAEVTALLLRDPAVAEHPVGRRFAQQRDSLRTALGENGDPASAIRTTMALHAVELAVLEFPDADRDQVEATALNIAVAVLDLDVRVDAPA